MVELLGVLLLSHYSWCEKRKGVKWSAGLQFPVLSSLSLNYLKKIMLKIVTSEATEV